MVKKRYTYKLRPGSQAVAHLQQEYARARWVWNECVHQFRSGNKPTAAKLDKLLTEARRSMSWLRDGSSVVQQQVIREYAAALNHSFTVKGRGRPRPKTRKRNPYVSLNYTTRGFRIKDGRLCLAGGISIPVVWSRELPSTPTSVRVYEDAAGWWWASFVVDVDAPAPLPESPSGIGIDWGVKTTAVTTDDSMDVSYQGHAARQAKGLARHQRRMALHHQKGAAEQTRQYKRAKKAAARLHRKVRWKRKEFARKWAKQVVDRHGFIAVEDFKPTFLARSNMARKAHDAAIGQMKTCLIEEASKSGRTLVLVKPAHTTMTCNKCGARAKHRIPLSVRTFQCSDCGHTDDRDKNAAKNVLDWAGFVPATCGGNESLSESSDNGSSRLVGIPRL